MSQVGADPVITQDDDSGGSWCDPFNDTSCIKTYDNLEIDENGVRLKVDEFIWDHVYTADAEPEESGWSLRTNSSGDFASASSGILLLDTSRDNAHWHYNRSWGASNSVGATFEARVKIERGYRVPIIWLRDGTYYEGLEFSPEGIRMFIDSGNVYWMDTTDDFHTYRFTIKNNDYMVYVDSVLRINGTGQHDSDSTAIMCSFGDFSDRSIHAGVSQWDYVRYNVQGAFPPAPPKKYPTGHLISTEIILPSGMAWDSLHVGKEEMGFDNYLAVTILDGKTFQPIPGYNELRNTSIDISSIDNATHSSIRLKATFTGDGSETPILKEWKVTWLDTYNAGSTTPAKSSVKNIWPGMGPAMTAAAGIILLSLAFAGSTEVGRYRLFPIISPLYTRLKKKEVLDQFTRGRIFEYIRGHPGDHYNSIKLELNINNGVLTYHLRTLERENFIKSMRDGMYKRFYPVDAKIPRINGFSLYSIQGRIMEVLFRHPGLTQKDISKVMDTSQQLVSYHVNQLINSGMLRAEKQGKALTYFPVEEYH